MKVYQMKETLSSYDGSITIEKGKLVMFQTKDRLVTLNGKTAIVQGTQIPQFICGCSYGFAPVDLKKYIKPCKFTCKDDEILIMEFRTDYHTYNAIGYNPHELYKKIIKMYNWYSGQTYHTGNFHKASYDYDINITEDYSVSVYKINLNMCYWNDESEYRDANDKPYKTFCGNYFDLYTSDNPKTFPNKSMR